MFVKQCESEEMNELLLPAREKVEEMRRGHVW